MKLWLVQRDGRNVGYDEWDSWIIVHDTSEGAMAASKYGHEAGIAADHIGEALNGYSAGDIVLGSFNEG